MTENQLRGYLHAKKQHSKTATDRAIYSELIEDLRQFPTELAAILALVALIGA